MSELFEQGSGAGEGGCQSVEDHKPAFLDRLSKFKLPKFLGIAIDKPGESIKVPDVLKLEYRDPSELSQELFSQRSGCYIVKVEFEDGRQWIASVGFSTNGYLYRNAVQHAHKKQLQFREKGLSTAQVKVATIDCDPDKVSGLYTKIREKIPFAHYVLNGDVWRKQFKQLFWAWWDRRRTDAKKDKERIMQKLETLWTPVFLDRILVEEFGENIHGDLHMFGDMPGVYILRERVKGSTLDNSNSKITYVGMSKHSMYKRVMKKFAPPSGAAELNYYNKLGSHEYEVAFIPIPRELRMVKWKLEQLASWLETYLVGALEPRDNKHKTIEVHAGELYNNYYSSMKDIYRSNDVRGETNRDIIANAMETIRRDTGIGTRNPKLLNQIEQEFAAYSQRNNRFKLLRVHAELENLMNELAVRLEEVDSIGLERSSY